jgi:hypothetical protein
MIITLSKEFIIYHHKLDVAQKFQFYFEHYYYYKIMIRFINNIMFEKWLIMFNLAKIKIKYLYLIILN